MAALHSLRELVSRILTRLEDGTLRAGFVEPVQRGSAHGFVTVIPDPEEPGELLMMVRLGVMRVPPTRQEAFFRKLLELNHNFHGRAAFGLNSAGVVTLAAGRPLAELDPGEVVDLIVWTSQQADHYDDLLVAEFGGAPPRAPGGYA